MRNSRFRNTCCFHNDRHTHLGMHTHGLCDMGPLCHVFKVLSHLCSLMLPGSGHEFMHFLTHGLRKRNIWTQNSKMPHAILAWPVHGHMSPPPSSPAFTETLFGTEQRRHRAVPFGSWPCPSKRGQDRGLRLCLSSVGPACKSAHSPSAQNWVPIQFAQTILGWMCPRPHFAHKETEASRKKVTELPKVTDERAQGLDQNRSLCHSEIHRH